MVESAHLAGFKDVKPRLITDWVARGLLGDGQRVGRGRGGGTGARFEWSEEQVALFKWLLTNRANVKSPVVLASIPVETWLYWGERWVGLPQLKRVLQSWWRRTNRTGWESSLEMSRKVAESIVPPQTPRKVKQDFRETLAGMIEAHDYSVEVFILMIDEVRVYDPGFGVMGEMGASSDLVARVMLSKIVAMSRFDEITDEMFLEARARLSLSVLEHAHWQSLSDTDSTLTAPPDRISRTYLINKACEDLLAHLGMLLMAHDVGFSPGEPPVLPLISSTNLYQALPVE
jgi:hypothetical protein